METEKIVCKYCGAVERYYARENGPHNECKCLDCDAHIKFLPKPLTDLVLYFGKYLGWKIGEVQDKGYLEWCLKNIPLKVRYRQALQEQVQRLTHQTA